MPFRYMLLWMLLSSSVALYANNEVERIVVSAERTTREITDVNAGLSILNQALLDQINGQHISQVLNFSAGTWISRGNGQEHLTAIRSPVLTGAGSCAAFYMALDGISLRAPGFCNANQLFDVNSAQAQTIEVLRGPASTLYGSNALHGLINVISPNASNEINRLDLSAGAYHYFQVAMDQRLSQDKTQLRLLANATHEGGFQEQSGFDQQKITLISQSQVGDWENKTLIDMSNLNQETAGFVQGFEVYRDRVAKRQNPNPEAYRDAKSVIAYSSFSKEDIRITPYVRWNQMAFLQHFLPWKALEQNGHSSLGLKLDYQLDLLGAQWLLGSDIDLSSAWLKETQDSPFSPSIPQGEHYDYKVNARQFAGFAKANWQWQNWHLSAGARAEQMQYQYDNLLSDGNACDTAVDICRFTRPSDQAVSFTYVSPQFELAYQLNQTSKVFAKISRGIRAPQATELFRLQNNQTLANISEVSMDALELAYQLNSPAQFLAVNLYYMEKDDVIIQDSNRQVIGNGTTRHQGLEIDWQLQITETLDLRAALSYQQHHYTSNLAISRQNIKGNKIDTSPEKMANLMLNWQLSEAFSSGLSVQFMDEYFLDPENTALYAGHTLIDWRLSWQIGDNMRIQTNIYNLLDEDYAERADFAFGNYRYFVGQQRRLFVEFSIFY